MIAVIAFIAFLFLYRYINFDPTHSTIAPKCIVKLITGFDCPGCGCQRLLFHWFNGRFAEGTSYNYFFPIGLIYIAIACVSLRTDRFKRLSYNKYFIGSFIALYFVWWILRNIIGV